MAIVSSSHVLGTVQRDGRRYVQEDHLDNIGKHWPREYLAAVGANYVAIRTNAAAVLAQTLIDSEIAQAMSVNADPVLVYATKNDFVGPLRTAYKQAEQAECARLAAWILNRIDSGWVTETQVQNAFGLTFAQWTLLKSKMTTLRTNYNAVLAAAGE